MNTTGKVKTWIKTVPLSTKCYLKVGFIVDLKDIKYNGNKNTLDRSID
jgi:hypothetical protein